MDLPFLPIRMEMRNPLLCISHPSSQKKRAQKTSSITVRKNQWHRRKLSPEKSVRKSDADQRRWAPQLSASMWYRATGERPYLHDLQNQNLVDRPSSVFDAFRPPVSQGLTWDRIFLEFIHFPTNRPRETTRSYWRQPTISPSGRRPYLSNPWQGRR